MVGSWPTGSTHFRSGHTDSVADEDVQPWTMLTPCQNAMRSPTRRRASGHGCSYAKAASGRRPIDPGRASRWPCPSRSTSWSSGSSRGCPSPHSRSGSTPVSLPPCGRRRSLRGPRRQRSLSSWDRNPLAQRAIPDPLVRSAPEQDDSSADRPMGGRPADPGSEGTFRETAADIVGTSRGPRRLRIRWGACSPTRSQRHRRDAQPWSSDGRAASAWGRPAAKRRRTATMALTSPPSSTPTDSR